MSHTAPGNKQYRKPAQKDYSSDKRYPNSAAAIFRAVSKSWLHEQEPGKYRDDLSAKEFIELSSFADAYEAVKARYPDVGRPGTASVGLIRGLGLGTDSDLEYYRVRAFTNFMNVPDFLFFIFARFISVERRIDSLEKRKKGLRQLLDGLKRLIAVIERDLLETEAPYLFSIDGNHKNEGSVWMANVKRLKGWADGFNAGELDVVHEAEKRI